jgi:hypothetical protein
MSSLFTHHDALDDPGDDVASAACGADVGSNGRDEGYILCPCNSAFLPGDIDSSVKSRRLHRHAYRKHSYISMYTDDTVNN